MKQDDPFRPLYLPIKSAHTLNPYDNLGIKSKASPKLHNHHTGLVYRYDKRINRYVVRKYTESSHRTFTYLQITIKEFPDEFNTAPLLYYTNASPKQAKKGVL